jgi:D-3-phosphoglycerate dehydrogenase
VGVRIAEQVAEYLKTGVAINAVNMPTLSPEQYRALGPYINLAERLGEFASYIAAGNPHTIRLTYRGRIGDGSTNLLRNAGLAGVLSRSAAQTVNLVNAMQLAEQRGWNVAERHESRTGHADSICLEVETDTGVTSVDGAVVLGRPRLMQVDGIQCEATLSGALIYMRNQDVPGVIGHVGTVLGRNQINIANFSLGRGETPPRPNEPLEAIAVVSTDGFVPETVLAQLRENPAVKLARSVQFRG